MSALEKNVTSDWFMISNMLKIKSLRWFIDIALFKKGSKIENSSLSGLRLIRYHKLTFQKTRALSESWDILETLPFFREVTSELKKMSESTLMSSDTLYYCSNEHVGTETVSIDRYKLMCRMHVPVYLFTDAQDDMFQTYHYHVGIYMFIFIKLKNYFLG